MKRIIDFTGPLVGLLLVGWLMIIIVIIIKFTLKGPATYVSKRIGKNCKTFEFYKFRLMRVGADAEVEKLMSKSERKGAFEMKNDPRVTKFAKFLRKTSLDGLPQLFKILNGTIIVGPPPCLPREYALMSEKENERLLVKQVLFVFGNVVDKLIHH